MHIGACTPYPIAYCFHICGPRCELAELGGPGTLTTPVHILKETEACRVFSGGGDRLLLPLIGLLWRGDSLYVRSLRLCSCGVPESTGLSCGGAGPEVCEQLSEGG